MISEDAEYYRSNDPGSSLGWLLCLVFLGEAHNFYSHENIPQNPQMDLQAQDRCHRIGQTKPVVVYRYVTANTVDQKIVERAGSKRKLEKMIIHKGKFKGNRDTGVLETKDLRELLEMSDHHKVVSSEGLLIKDQDLMALLDRSDLVSNAALQRKSGRPKKGQEHNGLFRVLATDIPASQ